MRLLAVFTAILTAALTLAWYLFLRARVPPLIDAYPEVSHLIIVGVFGLCAGLVIGDWSARRQLRNGAKPSAKQELLDDLPGLGRIERRDDGRDRIAGPRA